MGCANTKAGSTGAVAAYSAPEEALEKEDSGKTTQNKMDPPKVVVEGAQVSDGMLNGGGEQNGYSEIGEVNGCAEVNNTTKSVDDAGKKAAPARGEKDSTGDSENAENAKNETKNSNGATEESQNEENNKTEEGGKGDQSNGQTSDEAIAECDDSKDETDGEVKKATEEGAGEPTTTADEGTKADSGYETVESREGTVDENVE